jgi:hypothetical protein
MINKLVNQMYTSRDKSNSIKDMSTIIEYIKYMPNLLDFENKRVYFKKEIKKLKRSSYGRDLTLYIRRS